MFLSTNRLLTAGTDGHAVVWSVLPELERPVVDSSNLVSALSWQYPVKIHQNSSKAMVSCGLGANTILLVSGGDDGSLAFLIASTSSSQVLSYANPPILVNRAHASAVTSCAIIKRSSRILLLTSGNDEWVRLWEVIVQEAGSRPQKKEAAGIQDHIEIKRHKKIKTNVADVSSMAVLDSVDDGLEARVMLCGVGMEVIRVEWATEQQTKRS